jgi:cytochrome c oxidase subunit IV
VTDQRAGSGGRPGATRLDRAALAWGAVFVTVGGAFLLQELGVVEQVRIGVLIPLLLIVAGLTVAVSAAFPDREPTRE